MPVIKKSLNLAAAIATAVTNTNPVTEFTLDEHTVFTIPVSLSRVTTVTFPGVISAMDASGMTVDGTTRGCFQLAFQPSNSFFSLRALSNGASANLNVVFKQKVYVLEVAENPSPMLSVIFREPPQPIPVALANANTEAPRLTPSQCLGTLHKVGSYESLKQFYPNLLAGSTRVSARQTNEYDSFNVVLTAVTRFEAEDALVFDLELCSKTGNDLHYDPASFAVRVGPNLYHSAIADADGKIWGKYRNDARFVITGRPDGLRNDLSPTNNFTILVALTPSH